MAGFNFDSNFPGAYHGEGYDSIMRDNQFPSYSSAPFQEEDEESYDTSLFMGDLSVYSTEKDIRRLFSPYGNIERIRIKRGSSGKPHLSYGFITFSDRESAERALAELNGVLLMGRALRLGWAEPKSTIKVAKVKSEPLQTAQIHVSYISKQIDMLITEEIIRVIFSRFGNVVDVAIKKSQFDKRLRLQNGYGFIHFPLTNEGIQAAVDATYNIHQVTIDRVTYDCSLSRYLNDFQLPAPRVFPEFARREFSIQSMRPADPARHFPNRPASNPVQPDYSSRFERNPSFHSQADHFTPSEFKSFSPRPFASDLRASSYDSNAPPSRLSELQHLQHRTQSSISRNYAVPSAAGLPARYPQSREPRVDGPFSRAPPQSFPDDLTQYLPLDNLHLSTYGSTSSSSQSLLPSVKEQQPPLGGNRHLFPSSSSISTCGSTYSNNDFVPRNSFLSSTKTDESSNSIYLGVHIPSPNEER